jgi:hypothetical protein
MLLPGVLRHLYPILLQRAILLRLKPLLERAKASGHATLATMPGWTMMFCSYMRRRAS